MFDCQPLGDDGARPLQGPGDVWQVRGESTGVSRFDARRADASSPLSPLVGRQEEIDRILRRWDQAKRSEGRVVLLSGEPGIGKSRIAENLIQGLAGEKHSCLRFFCSPHHAHSSLYPFIAQFEGNFARGSSTAAKLDALRAVLKPTAGDLQRDVALIAELLAMPLETPHPALDVTPQQKREMTLTALIDQLAGLAVESPVLIVFEDVHWIDPTSLDLLNRTVARIADLPVLLVITFRPEFQPIWVGEPHVSLLPLSRLGRNDSTAIAGGVAHGKLLPDEVLERVLAHADGVPLFIEELTRALLESGLLRETPDSYVIGAPLLAPAIPTTLQASLVSRLDRLGSARELAVIGAAIGREFSHELVAAVAPLPAAELDAALERLTASGLVSRHGTPPAATYAFKHALVQDAAYETLLKGRRRQLHANIARALVELFPAMVESLPEVAARHFTEAGLAREAIAYWVKAGRLTRSANGETAKFFEQAVEVLKLLPESQSTLEQGVDLRLEWRLALNGLGDFRRALQCLREAEALAERLNDDLRRGRVCAAMTNPHVLLGELDEALAYGIRALEIAERIGDLRLRLPATTFLEQAYYLRGKYERVVELATGNLMLLPSDQLDDRFGMAAPPAVYDRGWLMMSLGQLGRFAEAAEPEAEAIRLVGPSQHAFTLGWAYLAAGSYHLRRGDWAQARLRFARAMALCREKKSVLMLPLAVAPSAWVAAQLGETREAQALLEEAGQLVARQAGIGSAGVLGPLYAPMGRAALLLGRLDDARRLAAFGVEACAPQPGQVAEALHLLGDVATRDDALDVGRAETHYRDALALAETCGMRPLIAHCRHGLGRLCRRAGNNNQAREHLTAATAMYRDMDMPFWLAEAASEMPRLQS
jgi:tetratricopeptide (TPR) repeat protein